MQLVANWLTLTHQAVVYRLCCAVLQTETFGTDMTPIARPAQPKEYGPPAVFLAAESDSSYVVGAILSVTGGMLIN